MKTLTATEIDTLVLAGIKSIFTQSLPAIEGVRLELSADSISLAPRPDQSEPATITATLYATKIIPFDPRTYLTAPMVSAQIEFTAGNNRVYVHLPSTLCCSVGSTAAIEFFQSVLA